MGTRTRAAQGPPSGLCPEAAARLTPPACPASLLRFEPGPARSIGLGPVSGRPDAPAGASRRSPPGTSQASRPDAARSAPPGAVCPTHRPRSSPAAAVGRSSRSRSRVPAAAAPTGCPRANEEGPLQAQPVIPRQPSRIPCPPGPHRKKRFDPHPQVVRHQPRRALPHDLSNEHTAEPDTSPSTLSVSFAQG